MSIAVFSNTIVLLIYPGVGLVCLLRLLQKKSFKLFLKKCGLALFLFIIFTLIMAKYHMNISSEGKPLYTGGEQGFFDSVVVGYAKMFTRNDTIALILSVLIVIISIITLLVLKRDLFNNDFPVMFIVFIVTNILMQLTLHKGYIATRVLLPFYSFIVICFHDLLSDTIKKIRFFNSKKGETAIKSLSCIVCILIIVLNLVQTKLTSTKDYKNDYKFSTWVIGERLTGEQFNRDHWNAAEEFYKNKYQKIEENYLLELSDLSK